VIRIALWSWSWFLGDKPRFFRRNRLNAVYGAIRQEPDYAVMPSSNPWRPVYGEPWQEGGIARGRVLQGHLNFQSGGWQGVEQLWSFLPLIGEYRIFARRRPFWPGPWNCSPTISASFREFVGYVYDQQWHYAEAIETYLKKKAPFFPTDNSRRLLSRCQVLFNH